jgi:hypothetical protein
MLNAATPAQGPLPEQNSLAAQDLIVQIEPWVDDAELRELKRVIDSTFLV